MKKLLLPLLLAIATIAVSCTNSAEKKEDKNCSENKKSACCDSKKECKDAKTYANLDEMLKDADNMVGKPVTFTGRVNHVCSHSGRRCFVMGEDPKTKIRVEAKGEFGKFDKSVVNQNVTFTGVLQENRIDEEYLAKWEDGLKKREAENAKKEEEHDHAEGEAHEHEHDHGSEDRACRAGYAKIETLRNKIKESGKGYYSVYFVDGMKYVINK